MELNFYKMETDRSNNCVSIPRYSNYLRIHHPKRSFSLHQNSYYLDEKPEFLNQFSSGMTNEGNKSFERALTAISKIEKKNVFGESRAEVDENIKKLAEEFENNKKKKEIVISSLDYASEPIGKNFFFL